MWWERKLCKAFSCIVTKKGKVFWTKGIDGHEELIEKYNIKDNEIEPHKLQFARIEIIPDNNEEYPYLYPEKEWKFVVDEQNKPRWLKNSHEQKCWNAFNKWKTEVYDHFNYLEARNPINPFLIEPSKINNEHIQLLKQLALVGASVRASIGDSVWDSVRASVWDSIMASIKNSVRASVYAYIGSLFPKIPSLYINGKYIYQPIIDLWMQGIIPSFDDTTYRLHTKNGIVYEATKKQLSKTK